VPLKIDVFCHFFPTRYWQAMLDQAAGSAYMQKRVRGIAALHDLDERLRLMEPHENYVQVLSLPGPPIEAFCPPEKAPELARIGNEGMAELVDRYPDRFVGFIAGLPMNNPDAAVREAEHAITQLGATGVQIYTNVNGAPLDQDVYLPLFALMAEHDLPIWVHPSREPDVPDYRTEERSKYDIWWAFGWPYETSVFMARMVFWGLFDRFPNIKIITHHMGGMIPYFEGRVGFGLDSLGRRTDEAEDLEARQRLQHRPYDYFRRFYADTALFGALPATECGLAFFGTERVLFASDFPFDPKGGALFIGETVRVVENMTASAEDKQAIFEGNARRLLRLRLPD